MKKNSKKNLCHDDDIIYDLSFIYKQVLNILATDWLTKINLEFKFLQIIC